MMKDSHSLFEIRRESIRSSTRPICSILDRANATATALVDFLARYSKSRSSLVSNSFWPRGNLFAITTGWPLKASIRSIVSSVSAETRQSS